jgi:hypothetical protein
MTTQSLQGRWARFLPITILIGLIAFHGVQIVSDDDDPQRSGAFAMFATVDIGATRRVIATVPGEDIVLEIPQALLDRRAKLMDHPSRKSAEQLARLLTAETWTIAEGAATSGGTIVLDAVRVQVYGLHAEDRTIVRHMLIEAVARRDS